MAIMRSIADLKRELQAREKMLQKLLARRRKIEAALANVDKKIRLIGGQDMAAPAPTARAGRKAAPKAAKATRGRRRAGGRPLPSYIEQVLTNSEGMRATDIAQAVRDAGYPTSSKRFYTIVSAALRDPKKFKRIGRGMYRLL